MSRVRAAQLCHHARNGRRLGSGIAHCGGFLAAWPSTRTRSCASGTAPRRRRCPMVGRLRRVANGTKPRYTATKPGQRGLHPVRAVRHEGAGVLSQGGELATRGPRGQLPRHEAGHEGEGPLSTTAANGDAGVHLWRVPAALLRDDPRKKPETPRCVGADMPLCCLYNAQIWEVHYHAEQGAQSGIAAAERCGSGSPEAESAARAQRPHFVVCKRSSGSGGAASTARTAASQPPLRPVFPPPMPGQQDQSRVMQAVVCARIDLAAVARCWFQCRSGQRQRWPSELAKRDRRPRLSRRRVPGLPGRFKSGQRHRSLRRSLGSVVNSAAVECTLRLAPPELPHGSLRAQSPGCTCSRWAVLLAVWPTDPLRSDDRQRTRTDGALRRPVACSER